MFMIMFVLDDSDHLDEILKAWEEMGITGATIIESTGMHRRRHQHIPMRFTYGDSSLEETGNITIYAIVQDESIVRKCLQSTEIIVGDLDQPNTGVFSAWPLLMTKGIPTSKPDTEGV